MLRGRAYSYLNDADMAKRHFGEALKYDPDYAPARKVCAPGQGRAAQRLHAAGWAGLGRAGPAARMQLPLRVRTASAVTGLDVTSAPAPARPMPDAFQTSPASPLAVQSGTTPCLMLDA